MDDYGILFLIVIALNSFFSFKAGETSGKWSAIAQTLFFLKKEGALKPESKVKNFKDWPESLKNEYTKKIEEV